MPIIAEFPRYLGEYCWVDKHKLFGYPADSFPEFTWITSLESRFEWFRLNYGVEETAAINLVREMIAWGGSQNGVLEKFEDRLGEINLYDLMSETISHLSSPKDAISRALKIPGMGLTYASKLLRFLDPDTYGALDSRICRALRTRVPEAHIPAVNSDRTKVKAFEAFVDYLMHVREQLDKANVTRPDCRLTRGSGAGWRAADIEMALFRWAELPNEP